MVENKRFHIVLASVIFASLTWVSVNMTYEYTVVRHIPVVLGNAKEGKALKHPVPKTMTVRFRGNGWLLAALYLSPDVKYFIDVSSLGPDDFVVTARDLLEHIKLPVSLQVVDVKPDTLLLALDEYRERRVPIAPRLVAEYREGYGQVGSMHMSPESVTVGGTRHIIETLTEWPTEFRKLENVRSAIDLDVALEQPTNYSLVIFHTSARVQINVQPFAEKTFGGIRVTATGAPPSREVIFIPPRMDVIVRGGIDQLAKLSNADFQATVNYQDLVEDSSGTINPTVMIPPDVKVVSRKPQRFQFIIRKKL